MTYIETLPIPEYAKSALEKAGYFTIDQLERESPKAISLIPRLGEKGFDALKVFVPAWGSEGEAKP